MNGQPAQPDNPTILARPSNSPLNRKTFIYIVVLLLVFLLGFISSSVLPFRKLPILSPQVAKITAPSTTPKPSIDESKLPISLALLTNPIVYEWRGSVKGKLTQKDDHTFTLVDDQGNSITITDITAIGDKFNIQFYDKTNNRKQILLDTIPLGSILLGDFFIFRDGPNIPVGSLFMKQ